MVVLQLEIERHVRDIEEDQAGAIAQTEEDVQRPHWPAGLAFVNGDGLGERQTQEILVEMPCALRIAAAPRVVVQAMEGVGLVLFIRQFSALCASGCLRSALPYCGTAMWGDSRGW
jgi:hypothetical protein